MKITYDRRTRQFKLEPKTQKGGEIIALLRSPQKIVRFDKDLQCFWIPELAWHRLSRAIKTVLGTEVQAAQLLPQLRPEEQDVDWGGLVHTPPLPHQIKEAKIMLAGGVCIGSEMGCGKSLSMLMTYAALKKAGEVDALVVLGPNNAISQTWRLEEIPKHLGKRVCDHTQEFLLLNYDRVRIPREFERIHKFMTTRRCLLLLDEVHLLANEGSQRAEAVKTFRKLAKWVCGTTGTVSRNRAESFMGVYRLLTDAEISDKEFRDLFRPVGTYYIDLDAIEPVFETFGIRHLKTELKELPPRRMQKVKTVLSPRHKKIYNQMRDEWRAQITAMDGQEYTLAVRKGIVLVQMTRLLQLAAHPGLLGDAIDDDDVWKFRALDEYLEEAGDQKVIVWSERPGILNRVANRYSKWKPELAHGERTQGQNARAIQSWKGGDSQMLCASILAFGEGLNLAESSLAFYFGVTWRFDKWIQSQHRIHRLTSVDPCTSYALISEGTIEERVFAALQEKEDQQNTITGSESTLDVLGDREWVLQALE
jgi:SNF2 family DNA or RNA helicase